VLWSSASIAAKFGLPYTEPLPYFTLRFLLAGAILLLVSHVYNKERLPVGQEWKQIAIFGAFNTALYLGIFIIALQFVAASITTLAVALNPLFISVMTSFSTGRKVTGREWISIGVGMVGVGIATYPLLETSHATLTGVALIGLCIVMYSFGSVYYASIRWTLTRMTVNAWQVFFGGLMLLPFAALLYEGRQTWNAPFWWSLAWLVFMVSIIAVQLWLRLLKTDAVRASMWMFLVPVFGIVFANILLDEPFTVFTAIGGAMVIGALYIGQRR